MSAAADKKEPLTSAADESIDEAVEPQTAPPEGTPEPAAKPIEKPSIERPTDIAKDLTPPDEVKAKDVSELETSIPKTLDTEISEPAVSAIEINDAAPAVDTPSNIITVERRVVKTPSRVSERAIPSVTKTETRRRIKTPARTTERTVPAVTKDIERRIDKGDGSFETVTETVVVTPQSVEYDVTPPVYETVTETIVVQEASTELVSIPAVYETVTETLQVNADGSTTVLNSTASSPSDKVAETSGGIMSVEDVVSKITEASTSDTVSPRRKAFRSRSTETIAPPAPVVSAPPPPAIASSPGFSDDVVIATGSRISAARDAAIASGGDEVVVTGASRKRKGGLSGIFAPISKAFKKEERVSAEISDGFADLSLESEAAPAPAAAPLSIPVDKDVVSDDLPAGARLVERTIPAVTKTVNRRVAKTPASTTERDIPAITKEVTVQVKGEDGIFRDVTTTIIIQEATTELVTQPPVYETVAETVVVTPEYVEYIVVDAAGNVISKRSEPKLKPALKPEPQAGQLTAGDYDDVLNPDLYKVYFLFSILSSFYTLFLMLNSIS